MYLLQVLRLMIIMILSDREYRKAKINEPLLHSSAVTLIPFSFARVLQLFVASARLLCFDFALSGEISTLVLLDVDEPGVVRGEEGTL